MRDITLSIIFTVSLTPARSSHVLLSIPSHTFPIYIPNGVAIPVALMSFSARGSAEQHVIPSGVSADAVLEYHVTLQSFEQAPKSWKLKGQEKFDWATKRKAEGNELFKGGKLVRAQKKYKASLDFVNSEYDMTDDEKKAAKDIKVSIHLNLAACELKQANWSKVLEECNKALELQKSNTKALLRRGKAYNEMNMWSEAKADLQTVIDTWGAAEIADAKKELNKVQLLLVRPLEWALFGGTGVEALHVMHWGWGEGADQIHSSAGHRSCQPAKRMLQSALLRRMLRPIEQ